MKSAARARRLAIVFATAALGVVVTALPAAAHVTVNPNAAAQGGYTKVSFRVPNERDNAGTTKLEINLPLDHPLASVSVKPMPGWTAQVDKTKLATPIKSDDGDVTEAVSKITWSGGTIAPGQFQEFDVSLGPLPKDTDQLVFKALQTYSNGEVVRWIDLPQPGGAEPEHPAPVLKLVPGGSSMPSMHADSASATGQMPQAPSRDGAARTLGAAGIVIGALGVGVGVFGLRRRPQGS